MQAQPTDADKPVRTLSSAVAEAGRLLRAMAVLAWLTVVLAQAIPAGLKGAATGYSKLIDAVDVAVGISSHLLALAASALTVGMLLLLGRERRLSIVSRVLLVLLSAGVLILAVPASQFRLSPPVLFMLAMLACALASVGAFEAMRQARSRAIGLVLALMCLAGVTHVFAAGALAFGADPQGNAALARGLSTGSMTLHAAATMLALTWMASRRRRVVVPPTTLALAAAFVMAWCVSRAQRPAAPGWTVFLARAVEGITPVPTTSVPLFFEAAVASLSLLLAAGAVLMRRQPHSVLGTLALTLTAATMIDVPGHALILMLAGLGAALAAYDERGAWDAMTGS